MTFDCDSSRGFEELWRLSGCGRARAGHHHQERPAAHGAHGPTRITFVSPSGPSGRSDGCDQ